MDIVTIINAHNNPPLLKNTIDSVRKWVTDKIIVIIDAAGWALFESFEPPENTELIKGVFHNCGRSPYKNIAIAMNYAYTKYPTADWYNYIESDVLYLNDLFKEDLATKSHYANLGFSQNIGRQEDIWLPIKIFNKPVQPYYMLGAVNFYSHDCVRQLMEIDFFTKVLEESKNWKGAQFPNFKHWAAEEIIYPTAAGVFGPVGNLSNYENIIKTSIYGNICERYAVRFIPEISADEITAKTSIAHPLKSIQRRRFIQMGKNICTYQGDYLADFTPYEATFFDASKGVIVWRHGQPTQLDSPSPSQSCLFPQHGARLKGQPAMHGLWAHPTDFGTIMPNMSVVGPASRIVYKLDKKYCGLRGTAGISDNAHGYVSTSVFCILCDGELIWRSQPMKAIGQAEDFQIMIENVDVLELVVVTMGSYNSCQAIWFDLILLSHLSHFKSSAQQLMI